MDKETEVLQNNIQSQLERLISQLKDLEELKGEAGLEEDEIAYIDFIIIYIYIYIYIYLVK